MEVIDLTYPLGPGLPDQPGDPPFTLSPARSLAVDGYEVTGIRLGSHTGTHVDAPRHFFPRGATLDQFPLERLIGPGVSLDCREATEARRLDQLLEQLRLFPPTPPGIVLLRTDGAHVTVAMARLLLEAGAGLVGTDAPSLDVAPYPVHRLLLARDVLIVENLRGLDRLGVGRVSCAFLPLALTGTDGAPIRAVAWR
jgi:arylformamidase